MRVGVLSYRFGYYTYTRAIINQAPGVDYIPVHDVFSVANRLSWKINGLLKRKLINTFDLNNQFQDFGLNKVDLLHFMNGVSYGTTPWVSSFETILPRLSSVLSRQHGALTAHTALERRAMDALAGPHCKRLLPWSACAERMQRALLEAWPAHRNAITEKMQVLHPPQPLLIDRPEDKPIPRDGKLRFMMVGAAFLRKGGREVLDTFQKLIRHHGYPLELIIVSSLRIEDYAAKETPADVRAAQAIIEQNRDWITHYQSLPNDQVLDLMKQAHVGLLPTYADTYGLSVLEFQASGCPVISTDVRALPEINNNTVGWLIPVPKNDLGEALYDTAEGRAAIRNAICIGLEQAVHEIFADRTILPDKAQSALHRIRQHHNPADYAETLRRIYAHAVA